MQVTKGTWCMCEQCVPGSLSSSPTQEPGNKARVRCVVYRAFHDIQSICGDVGCLRMYSINQRSGGPCKCVQYHCFLHTHFSHAH